MKLRRLGLIVSVNNAHTNRIHTARRTTITRAHVYLELVLFVDFHGCGNGQPVLPIERLLQPVDLHLPTLLGLTHCYGRHALGCGAGLRCERSDVTEGETMPTY